jgi:hypothetical protein
VTPNPRDEDLSFYLAALDGLGEPPAPAMPAIRLARAIRRLAAAALASQAPGAVLESVQQAVTELAVRMETFDRGSGGRWGLAIAGPAGRYLCHPTYGPANPFATPISVEFTDGEVTGRASYGVTAEGRFGQVHGAILTAGVVGLASLTAVSNGRRGSLQSLDIRYLAPAPVDAELVYRVRIDEAADDFTRVWARVRHADADLLEAVAVLGRAH